MSLIGSILIGIAGLAIKVWLAMRNSTARMLGRAETREAQATDTLKAVKEVRNVEDHINRLPDSDLDSRLRKWAKPGDRE